MLTFRRWIAVGTVLVGLAGLMVGLAEAGYVWPLDEFPPPVMVEPPGHVLSYRTGILVRNTQVTHPTHTIRLPDPGGPWMVDSFFDVTFDLSTDNGGSWEAIVAPAHAVMQGLLVSEVPGVRREFETEMLQLDLRGGNLPPYVVIQESPSLVSPGHVTVESLGGGGGGGGGYKIDSFFDVFTELSVDYGNDWVPANNSLPLVGTPEPGTMALLACGGLCGLVWFWRRRKRV